MLLIFEEINFFPFMYMYPYVYVSHCMLRKGFNDQIRKNMIRNTTNVIVCGRKFKPNILSQLVGNIFTQHVQTSLSAYIELHLHAGENIGRKCLSNMFSDHVHHFYPTATCLVWICALYVIINWRPDPYFFIWKVYKIMYNFIFEEAAIF